MADLKLDNEFGAELAGAGSRPAFANLVRFRPKDVTQKEFPTTLILTRVRVKAGATFDEFSKLPAATPEVKCSFRIANEFFVTESFESVWEGVGRIRFMLASNVTMLVRVITTDSLEKPFGYARLRLGRVGEGGFNAHGEVKDSEYVTPQDEVLGHIAVSFKVTPNFTLHLSKLDSQYDTKNIPSLINVISAESKTLRHRMGAFQGALRILQSIIAELQGTGAIGSVTGKQLSVILNQASSAQGIELFEDLLWDLASLSFATDVFEPSLTFFPSNAGHSEEGSSPMGETQTADGNEAIGDGAVVAELARHPRSFAVVRNGTEPVILVAETDADVCRWTAALHVACRANSEADEEKARKLVIPEYCKDAVHKDHPTVGWLRRKKREKWVLTGSFVRRFFSLTCDEAVMRYNFAYGKEASDDVQGMTKVDIDDGTRILLPKTPPVPTPFALQIIVQKVSDFSFNESEKLRVVVQLGSQRQCSGTFIPRESTSIDSTLLLPVEQASMRYAHASVMTSNIGWFGEEVDAPSKSPAGDQMSDIVSFFVGEGSEVNKRTALGICKLPFAQVAFGRQQDMTLTLEGDGADGAELTIGVTLRRLGQCKTAWPAVKTTLLQARVPGANPSCEADQHLWEGPCLVRTAPQGLEIFSPTVNPDERNKPVMTIDYYSIEAMTDINASTLDVAIIIEEGTSIQSDKNKPTERAFGPSPGCPPTPDMASPVPQEAGGSNQVSPLKRHGGSVFSPGNPGAAFAVLESPPPARPKMDRRGSFGMVNRKGKSLSSKASSLQKTTRSGAGSAQKVEVLNDYYILRISPCPAEALKDLMGERRWMFQCRNMLLYITHKLHALRKEADDPGGIAGSLSTDPSTREKLAIASCETYKTIRADMDEIIKTSDWRRARGVGFTEKHIRMFFRLQRLSVYFAKLLESKAHPLWGFDDPIDPRDFARKDLDKIFSSQYVQSGAFGAEAQGIENSVKGIGWALKALHRRLDETKLFYHQSPEDIAETSRIFFEEYFLRCTGELGAHVTSDDVLREVPIEVVVAFVCFLVKRDNAFHDLLVENSLEPDTNAFLTSILSIDSMIRRLTKRTELEIVAQWPNEGDIADDATSSYIISLLGNCSPDVENDGKLSSRAPEELMRMLERYVQLIASQCRSRGNLGAKIFEGMFAAMPSYATNAAAAIFALNHMQCREISGRYLAAILNDMSRSSGLVHELLEGNQTHLEGIPIDVTSVQGGVFSAGVEVACLLADVALNQVDDVCAEFFQAEWYADDDSVLMRKACKLLVMGIDQLQKEVVAIPFFDHVVGAAVEKVSFRYLAGLVLRCTDQSGGKMITEEELERIQGDVDTMQQYLSKYEDSVLSSVYHLREALVFLTEKPEILQQAVFVDVLKRHHGKEEHVMKMLKILTAVRYDLRNFYVPAWLNKLAQKQNAVVQERVMHEMEGDGRTSRITFDVFEWVLTANVAEPNGGYIYKYLMCCLKAARG